MYRIFTMYESVTLSLSDNLTLLSTNYFPPLNIYEDSEIALIRLQTYNTFPNINKTNNRISFNVNILINKRRNIFVYTIEIEEDCYDILELNEAIQRKVQEINENIQTIYKSNDLLEINAVNFELTTDSTRFKSIIKCNFDVNLNIDNSIASVLGFSKKMLKKDINHFSDKVININSVNSIKVLCSIANGSFCNDVQSHSIYEFFLIVTVGSKIVESPRNLIYYPLTTTSIDSITIE